jgi:glycerophosphoryl diester phosphodiesterase
MVARGRSGLQESPFGITRAERSLLHMTFGPGSDMRVIGHRGAAGVAPENTLPSLRHAARAGAHAVEFDLQCTSDGRLVVLHDPTLHRTTDGSGRIDELTLEEAQRLDAGYRFTPDGGQTFPYRGKGVRIPSVEEAFEEIGDLPAVVEIKSQRAAERMREWLARSGAARQILVGSFSRRSILAIGERAERRCASEDELRPYVLTGKLGLSRWWVPEAIAVMVPERFRGVRIVTRRFVRRAHDDGLGVIVRTVNPPDAMRRLWDWGVDGLISDDPGRALRVLQERMASGLEA